MKTPLFNEIREFCKQVEKEENIIILFAVENGSRAWRMESTNSDYDVRFVFHRPIEEYITLKKSRDVIERMKGDIDLVGFDIFKYLHLLAKSNPTTIEWLMSDIVYYGKQNAVFKRFALKQFNPAALYYHYKSLCRQNFEKYIKSGKQVSLKKYLYVFRGLINSLVVVKNNSIPLIQLRKAMNAIFMPKNVRDKINEIVALKKSGVELVRTKRIPELDGFVEEFLKTEHEVEHRKSNTSLLDKELRKILL